MKLKTLELLHYANRLLTNSDRIELKPVIEEMFSEIPETMSRKIPEANVQQACFVQYALDLKTIDIDVLCVGSYEDTACEFLKKRKLFKLTEIDPNVNGMDLHSFYIKNIDKAFDLIFSISVIEHVKDDIGFIKEICKLLKTGGIAYLTFDFGYLSTKSHFAERFYTEERLINTIVPELEKNNCKLVSDIYWTGEPNFFYQGYLYSLGTLVFEKI